MIVIQGGGSRGKPRELATAFNFTLLGALDFGVLSAGESILDARLVIDEVFDDPGTMISLGLASNPDSILPTTAVDPLDASTYGNGENFPITAADAVRLKVFPFTSTQGSGRAIVLVG